MTALPRLDPPSAQASPSNAGQDPLVPKFASSTLIRLYLAQGHVSKACALAKRLCAEDPLDGQALALLARCEQSLACTLQSRVAREQLLIRWELTSLAALGEGAFVHIHLFDASAKRANPELRRIRCDSLRGKRTIPLNLTQGACVAYLGVGEKSAAQAGTSPRILAVGAVHRWRHAKELCRTRM